MQFSWQWDNGTFSTKLDVIWGMSVNMTSHDDWLVLSQEETLEPELPICDPHHHLWEFRTGQAVDRYLLDDIRADLESGHTVTSTVFIECGAMYKTDGAQEMRVIGETEFVNGIAAMSASGLYGPARVAAGIIGSANLSHRDAIAPRWRRISPPAAAGSAVFATAAPGTPATRFRGPAARRPSTCFSTRRSARASRSWRSTSSASRAGVITRRSPT